jgi:hypothetical protein
MDIEHIHSILADVKYLSSTSYSSHFLEKSHAIHIFLQSDHEGAQRFLLIHQGVLIRQVLMTAAFLGAVTAAVSPQTCQVGGNVSTSSASDARVIRVIKILRILRIARVLKLVKFVTCAPAVQCTLNPTPLQCSSSCHLPQEIALTCQTSFAELLLG